MIQLPSKDQNGHDDNNHEQYDHSNDCPCDYPNLHIVLLADVICVETLRVRGAVRRRLRNANLNAAERAYLGPWRGVSFYISPACTRPSRGWS